ncbi:MAG: tetratricopeptide repeat protein [Pedobacter sp.]|jgi:tetratricopeptide (TPR) repeat protein
MKKAVVIFSLVLCTSALFAQRNKQQQKKDVVIVTGKMLSQRDSNLVKDLFFEGLQEKLVMNYPQAAAGFSKVLEVDPANDAAMYELGSIKFADDRLEEAEYLIRNAVTVNPENEWYWVLLADIYKKGNKIDKLVPVLTELMKIDPDNEAYFYDKANALLLLKKVDEAIAAYDEVEKRFGPSEELSAARQRIMMQQGKSARLEEELRRQIAANPQEIRNYIFLNEVLTKAGQRGKAIEILNKAKQIAPSDALIRLALADQYKALRQFDNTFIELKVAFNDPNMNIDEKVRIVLSFFPMFADMKARANANELTSIMVKVHPDEAKAFAVHGDVLFQERKFAEAKESYLKALKINDQVYQIWEQLLRIEINLNQFQELVKDGQTALSIFPNQAALYLYTGIGLAQTGQHERAVSYLKNTLDLETENKEILMQVYSMLGDSYNALKKHKESDQSYDKALEIDPGNSYVLNNYAYYLSLRGENLEQAARMSKRSIELDPGNSSSEDTYAWILFRLKKYDEARVWIEKALGNGSGTNATRTEHYGDILFFLGEGEKALEQWQKAKSLGSKSNTLDKKINEKKYSE